MTNSSRHITVYGLKNCDSCRKAMKWLKEKNIEANLHDVREDGLPKSRAKSWIEDFGWETVLNQRSTTWRGLPDKDRAGLTPAKALALLSFHPALLKRPVFDLGNRIVIGFAAGQKSELEQII